MTAANGDSPSVLSVAAKEPVSDDALFADVRDVVCVGRDIECVSRTIKFAHKAGLAIFLPRNYRRCILHRREHIHGTNLNAFVAGNAAGLAYEFDHAAIS
jgi:hypothetical protein